MKITSEIFQVGGSGYTSDRDAAIYLICFEGHAALVDAGCGDHNDLLLKNIKACNVQPSQTEYLLITHCHYDHTGGAKELRNRLGVKAVAHELEVNYLEKGDNTVTAAKWYGSRLQPFPVDLTISGSSETIVLGQRKIEALHIPGHSPGSMVYVTESDGLKVIFAQDVHGPIHPEILSDPNAYQQSLEKLIRLEADILCEGHFGIYRGKKSVKSFIQSFADKQ